MISMRILRLGDCMRPLLYHQSSFLTPPLPATSALSQGCVCGGHTYISLGHSNGSNFGREGWRGCPFFSFYLFHPFIFIFISACVNQGCLSREKHRTCLCAKGLKIKSSMHPALSLSLFLPLKSLLSHYAAVSS